MADSYSASQIIGKQLNSITKVPIKRMPKDSAPTVFTVEPGKTVGIVYSYLAASPEKDRKNLWWMFNDASNKPYYAEHLEGRYNLQDLKEQGAESVKEQREKEEKKNETTKDFIERLLKYGIGALIIFGIAKTFIAKKIK